MFIKDFCQKLEVANIKYALVGGYAVALHGAVRGTVDIDFVIQWEKQQLLAVEQCMKKMGLISQLPIDAEMLFNFRDEYIKQRNLVAWHFYHPKDISQQVDLIINYDLSNQNIQQKDLGGQIINILELNDLIEMKRRSGRPQDLEDIKSLKLLQT